MATGVQNLTASLQYGTDDETTQRVTETDQLDVEPLSNTVTLQASQADARDAIAVALTNKGNVPIENVTIEGTASEASISDAYVELIAAQSSRTVTLNVTELRASQSAV
jgi:hypothetical protein